MQIQLGLLIDGWETPSSSEWLPIVHREYLLGILSIPLATLLLSLPPFTTGHIAGIQEPTLRIHNGVCDLARSFHWRSYQHWYGQTTRCEQKNAKRDTKVVKYC